MLFSTCWCVCSHCHHLCIPCFIVVIVLAPSVVILSAMDLPRLPLPWMSPTIGTSSEPSEGDNNDNPAGEPYLLVGRASQTLTAPWCLCHARRPYLSPSLSSSVLSSQNAPFKVSVAQSPRNCMCTLPSSFLWQFDPTAGYGDIWLLPSLWDSLGVGCSCLLCHVRNKINVGACVTSTEEVGTFLLLIMLVRVPQELQKCTHLFKQFFFKVRQGEGETPPPPKKYALDKPIKVL